MRVCRLSLPVQFQIRVLKMAWHPTEWMHAKACDAPCVYSDYLSLFFFLSHLFFLFSSPPPLFFSSCQKGSAGSDIRETAAVGSSWLTRLSVLLFPRSGPSPTTLTMTDRSVRIRRGVYFFRVQVRDRRESSFCLIARRRYTLGIMRQMSTSTSTARGDVQGDRAHAWSHGGGTLACLARSRTKQAYCVWWTGTNERSID